MLFNQNWLTFLSVAILLTWRYKFNTIPIDSYGIAHAVLGIRIRDPVGFGPFYRIWIRDPNPESSPPDLAPDPALVMYIYQIIVSRKMFLTNFFEKLSCYRHYIKVIPIHYVTGINWQILFLRWIRIMFCTVLGGRIRMPNTGPLEAPRTFSVSPLWFRWFGGGGGKGG
jgi:hypothetical protein